MPGLKSPTPSSWLSRYILLSEVQMPKDIFDFIFLVVSRPSTQARASGHGIRVDQ